MERAFTVAIQLTGTTHCEKGLAGITLVWAELITWTLRRKSGILGVAKWKLVASAAFELTDASRCAVGLDVTVTVELIGAYLETVIG